MDVNINVQLDELHLIGREWDREDAIRDALVEHIGRCVRDMVSRGGIPSGSVHVPEIHLTAHPRDGAHGVAAEVGRAVTTHLSPERR